MVTGSTHNSRLDELKKYAINVSFEQQYVSGGNWTTNGVDFNESVEDEKYVYYINGIEYIDYVTSGSSITHFTYTVEGTTSSDFIDVPYVKDPNKSNIISKPKIIDDVFIIRDNLSAFNKNYKLEYINDMVDLTTYAGGKFFNIVNNT